VPNRAVLIEGYVEHCVGVVEGGGGSQSETPKPPHGWRAWRQWVKREEGKEGRIDTMYLREQFGHVCVTVHNCAQKVRGLV